jgi:phasin family protein
LTGKKEIVMSKTKMTTEAVEQVFEAGKDRFEQVVKASTEAGQKNFESLVATSKKQMDEAMKALDEAAVFAKGNVEAVMASSQAATKGIESLAKAAGEYTKTSFTEAQSTVKSLSAAKTAKDFFEIQNSSVKKSYDSFVAESSKMSEMMVKLMTDAFEPLSSRMAVAVETFAKPVK